MNPQQFSALLGFLFVAAWAALGFGDAVLCLIGAGVFYLGMAVYRGELDLEELSQRASQSRSSRSVR